MERKPDIQSNEFTLPDADIENLFSDQIINYSRSMISIINRNYIYEKVNTPFCKAFGQPKKSFIGKSIGEVWGTETFEEKIKTNLDLCFSGRAVKYEASFNTPKSEKRYFEVIFRPIKTKSNKISHLMAETFDVTELKISIEAANQIQNELREKEINYKNRLLQAQRLETLGILAGGIAHDFNNILATISGYTEMLHEDLPEDSAGVEKTEKIIAAISRAKSLTNQILTFSRQVEHNKTTIDINGILKETIDFVRSSLPAEINIETDIPDGKILIIADPTQLFRTFLNLLTNAIQSMEGRKGLISVCTGISDGKGIKNILKGEDVSNQYALVTFKDNGKGMDSSMIQRIFEPFYTTREIGKGTGLGLSVVYGIVTELGGEIMVSSKEESGSVFTLYLPVTQEAESLATPEKKDALTRI